MENRESQQQQPNGRKQHKWLPAQTKAILQHLINTIQAGHHIEKPTALIYYGNFLRKNRENEDPDDPEILPLNISNKNVLDHVRNWRNKYKEAVKWSNQTGQGVRVGQGQEVFRDALLKKCLHYDMSEEIWGCRLNIKIPSSRETSRIGRAKARRQQFRLHPDNEDDDENNIDFEILNAPSPGGRERSPRGRSESPTGSERRSMSPGPFRDDSPPPHSQSSQGSMREDSQPQNTQSTQGSSQVTTQGSSQRRPGPPGRNLDRAGQGLSNLGTSSQKSYKHMFQDIQLKEQVRESERAQVENEKVKLQQQQLDIETRRLDAEIDLKRDQFEYLKLKDDRAQALEMERELTRRKALEIEELKLKLELAKYANTNMLIINNDQ